MHDLQAGQCWRSEPCGILQARAKELRAELLNSKRLEAHFEAHPGIICFASVCCYLAVVLCLVVHAWLLRLHM